MAETSTIEWTDATWNPITGCEVVSPGCTNCYAMRLAGTRLQNHPSRRGLTRDTKAGPVWNGRVRLNLDWLTQPMQWRRPRRIFVCAHSDLFGERVPDEWIDQVFAVMALAPWHTYQVLTKRAARMRQWATERWQPAPARTVQLGGETIDLPAEKRGDTRRDKINRALDGIEVPLNGSRFWTPAGDLKARGFTFPLPNIWLGVSAEDQRRADERVPDLIATPAAVRFVSAEPLLGPLDLSEWIKRIDHCGACGAENKPQDDDRCPSCGAENILISTWGEAQAERYHSGERYDEDSEAGCADIDGTNPSLDWVIVGGESGPAARPMHPDWARSLRDQCVAAGVPFHFKQWGAWLPGQNDVYDGFGDGRRVAHWQDGGWGSRESAAPVASNYVMWDAQGRAYPGGSGPKHPDRVERWASRVGKKAAGRLLDGVTHDGFPGGAT